MGLGLGEEIMGRGEERIGRGDDWAGGLGVGVQRMKEKGREVR